MGSPYYTPDEIAKALAEVQLRAGNVLQTARALGIPRSTLQRWYAESGQAGTKPGDYGALWAQAQELALTAAVKMAQELTAATAENLTALTRLATAAQQAHLDYRDGRRGMVVQQNNLMVAADGLVAALLSRRHELGDLGERDLIEGPAD